MEALVRHLAAELGDPGTAEALARLLAEDALSWRAPEVAPARIGTILAFTFGNRMEPSGNRTPGPVNAALAGVAAAVHRATGAPVHAQWEVAEALAGVPVVPIWPARDARAEPLYLNTADTVAAFLRAAPAPGLVGIVAHRDHAMRCVMIARRMGLEAGVPAGFAMPVAYDPESGQPWCRSRLAYLMHDVALRAADRRDMLGAAI